MPAPPLQGGAPSPTGGRKGQELGRDVGEYGPSRADERGAGGVCGEGAWAEKKGGKTICTYSSI